MLRFQNGRFYTHGVSFTMPDGFLMETEPEYVHQYGISAWSPDESCYVEWDVEEDCTGTESELQALFVEISPIQQLSEIQPVTVNGLSGHQVIYQSAGIYFLEVRLSLSKRRFSL